MRWIDKVEAEVIRQGFTFHNFETEKCGFSNGYLKGKKGGRIRFEKLKVVADNLGVDIMFFSDCDHFFEWYPFLQQNEKKEQTELEMLQELRDDVRGLLYVQKDMSKKQIKSMMNFAKFLKSQGEGGEDAD